MVHQPSNIDWLKPFFMAQCICPYMLKDLQINVPCGKCKPCRSRRAAGWAFRMMQEQKVSETSFMLTLTYNTDHVPITKHGYRSLDKTHVQKYIKRLRKLQNQKPYDLTKPIRYYACGEYGSKTKRPHYHLLIFNAHPNNLADSWKLEGKEIGTIHLAPLNMATIQYAFKYLQKSPTVGKHDRDDRNKEFQLFSKGLGANYLNERTLAWHKADISGRMFLPDEDGKKVAMPRYYKQKMYDDFEKLIVKEKMQELNEIEWQKMVAEYGDTLQTVLHERRINSFKQMHSRASQNEKL